MSSVLRVAGLRGTESPTWLLRVTESGRLSHPLSLRPTYSPHERHRVGVPLGGWSPIVAGYHHTLESWPPFQKPSLYQTSSFCQVHFVMEPEDLMAICLWPTSLIHSGSCGLMQLYVVSHVVRPNTGISVQSALCRLDRQADT